MPLHGQISLDASDAYKELRAMRREMASFAKETQQYLNPTFTLNLDKNAFKEAKATIASLSKEELASAREVAKINEINSRTRLNELKAVGIEERRQIGETSRAQKEAQRIERQAQKEARQALQAQKAEGAALAREIDAGFRHNGVTINRFGDEVKTVTGHLRDMEAQMRKAKQAREELLDKASTAATIGGAGLFAGLGLATNEGIKFEESFKEVRKTVDGTSADLERIQKQLRDMAAGDNPIPIDINELDKIAGAAGQLGIATPKVVSFTETIAKLGETTNLTTDEAASSLAQFSNIVQMNQDNFGRLGSTVVDLGNKSAATEKDIVSMGLRLAGAGHQVKMSEAEILSYATALASVGIEAEAGGTAVSKTFIDIDKAVRNGGAQLQAYAKISGESAAQFKKDFQTDAANATEKFVAGLGRIQKSGGDVFGVLEALGIQERRQQDALLRLAGAGDLLNKTLDTGRAAWQQNIALNAEAEKSFKTTASQIQITKNTLVETGIEISKTTIPVTRVLASEVRDALKWFNSLDDTTKDQIVRFGLYAGAALLVAGRLKGIFEVVTLVKNAQNLATIATVKHTTALEADAIAARATGNANVTAANAAAAGWMRAAGAIGLVVAAGAAAYKSYTEWTPDFQKMSPGELNNKYGAYGHAGGGMADWLGSMLPGGFDDQVPNKDLYKYYVQGEQKRGRLPRSFEAWRSGVISSTGQRMGDGDIKPADSTQAWKDELAKQQKEFQSVLDGIAKNNGLDKDVIAGLGKPETSRGAKKAAHDAEMRQRAEARDALKLERDQLQDLAKAYDLKADAVEKAARREIEALKGISEALGSGLKKMQDDLKEEGVKGNPLGGQMQAFLDFLNLKRQANGISAHYGGVIADLRAGQSAAQGKLDILSGGDGRNPGNTSGSANGYILSARGGAGSLAPADPRQFLMAGALPSASAHNISSKAPANQFADMLSDFAPQLMRNLPKGWGSELLPDDTNAGRMFFQNILQGQYGRQLLNETSQAIAAPGFLSRLEGRFGRQFTLQGDSRDDIAANLLRQIGNSWDLIQNPAKELAEAFKTTSEYAKDYAKDAFKRDEAGAAWRHGLEDLNNKAFVQWGALANEMPPYVLTGDGAAPLGPDIPKNLKLPKGVANLNAPRKAIRRVNPDFAAGQQAEELLGDPTIYKERLDELKASLEYQRENLDISGKLSDLKKQENAWIKEDAKRQGGINSLTDTEKQQREEIRDILRDIAEIDFQNQVKSLNDEIEALNYAPGKAREAFLAWQDLQKNPNLSEGDRHQIFDKENQLRQAQETKQIWTDVMGTIAHGALQMENGVGGALRGIAQDLKQLALQFAEQKLFEALLGLAGQKGGFTPGFNGNDGLPRLAQFGDTLTGYGLSPGAFDGSHATGLDRVPFDGYRALLHRDEMVLTRSDANMMRALRSAPSQTINHSSGGNVTIVVQNVHTSDAGDFMRQMQRAVSGNRQGSYEQLSNFRRQLYAGGDD